METNTRSKLITIVIICFLLGSSGYLYVDNSEVKELNEKQTLEMNTLDDVSSMFQEELKTVHQELEKYKGKNKELEILVSSAQTEIAIKEQEIKKLLREKASLEKLKDEVTHFRAINEKNLSRIKNLENNRAGLKLNIDSLKAENVALKDKLSALEIINDELEKKIELASVLKAEKAWATAERLTNSGRYTKARLKKADRLLLGFELEENRIAEPGSKTIFIRIIDGAGNIIENNESGYFQNNDKNFRLPYTAKTVVEYANKKEKVMASVDLRFNKDAPERGGFKIEFYCDGDFIGSSTIDLK